MCKEKLGNEKMGYEKVENQKLGNEYINKKWDKVKVNYKLIWCYYIK